VAIVCGILALVKAKKEPAVYGGKGMAIGGIVTGGLSFLLLPFIGIIAAIAIPSLLRARVSANEAATIGDVRTVISAQAAYTTVNGGYYDTLECLGAPGNCIPDYSGPTFLDPTLASGIPKNGYRRTLYLGEAADLAGAAQPISPSSVRSYAYVAVPLQRGQTGVRAFCGDVNGVVCATADGSEPEVADGQCVTGSTCVPLN
jgi:type II secretory pathway pseudopilin PulG